MKGIEELLRMECPDMMHEIAQTLGRELTLREEIEIAMLSGAFKSGGELLYSDLQNPDRQVTFPQYLQRIGYPIALNAGSQKHEGNGRPEGV